MKSLRFFRRILASPFLLGLVVFSTSLKAAPAKNNQPEAAPTLNRSEDRPQPAHRKSAKEKEYASLARKLREADAEFEKNWRAAKPSERQKLRSERLEKLQPTLARMNQLAAEIRQERKGLSGEVAPKPVPVTEPLGEPEEIKGKSEGERRNLGIAVGALHQKPSDSADAQAATVPGK